MTRRLQGEGGKGEAATGCSSRRRGTAAGGRRTAARTGTATHPKRRRSARKGDGKKKKGGEILTGSGGRRGGRGRRRRLPNGGLRGRRADGVALDLQKERRELGRGGPMRGDWKRRPMAMTRGAAAEVLLVLAELREATARVDVDRSGGATRLESAAAAERGGSRGYGATEVERGNGAVADFARAAAKLAVAAEQCGGDPSDGKRRPEFAGVWRRVGVAWGERGRARRLGENWGNGRGDHGDRFYWLGAVGSWPRRTESTGNGLRSGLRRRGRSGVVRRRFWRGKKWGRRVEEVGRRGPAVGASARVEEEAESAATWGGRGGGFG
uniref:Retrotransposon protein, putative, Ty3-gypsy subclass n=3 Tax=Oryza sativa subsp. japonica TaxID=39947 RepID=Q94I10_ORYSJ|nr:Hypothetical protein [Oryza sativa Japonica Group]AAP52847.1 retrotransposon protein, putative, Ty3-gypsy subclass [Oryza sativa Japonica Group]